MHGGALVLFLTYPSPVLNQFFFFQNANSFYACMAALWFFTGVYFFVIFLLMQRSRLLDDLNPWDENNR